MRQPPGGLAHARAFSVEINLIALRDVGERAGVKDNIPGTPGNGCFLDHALRDRIDRALFDSDFVVPAVLPGEHKIPAHHVASFRAVKVCIRRMTRSAIYSSLCPAAALIVMVIGRPL